MNEKEFNDFSYEFFSKLEQPTGQLNTEAEQRLRKLAEGHNDIIGAAVSLDELTGDETPHFYQARIVVYMRPSDLASVEKADDPVTALEEALESIERQVRDYREKLRERWKQP